jgi:chemotaxis protein methyltransferase CheR
MILEGAAPKMTEAERQRISDFIEKEFGIKMPVGKKTLLEGRLSKRLSACGMKSFGAYFDFVTKDPAGRDEFLEFADLVSTHETSFFREPGHYEFLSKKVLPALLSRPEARSLQILSAACSTGEEAYTLGMVVSESLAAHRRDRPFAIEGVDLSVRAVAIASRGVYLAERTKSVPAELKKNYLMRSKDPRHEVCRFVPELRKSMSFHTGNLLGDLGLSQYTYDIIFCRNVLIYFDPPNQRRVISTLLSHLKPEGYLFLGHAETVVSLDLAVRTVAHAVYQKA